MSKSAAGPFHQQLWMAVMGLFVTLFATAAHAETRINSVFADRINKVLFIDGAEFRAGLLNTQAPYVELSGQPLVVKPGFTDTHIEAILPNVLADGEYQVFVSRTALLGLPVNPHANQLLNDNRTARYSLSLITPTPGPKGDTGAAGPQGQTGATGAQGVAGPTGASGSQGPQGPQGPMGPMGMTGATGATGAIGMTGPQGSQGATGPAGPAGTVGGTTHDLLRFAAGTHNFTVPAGISRIDVEAWGGGGGGGANGGPDPSGGGGGGYQRCVLSVQPGDVLVLQVGAGGRGGNGSIICTVDCTPLAGENTRMLNAASPLALFVAGGGGSGNMFGGADGVAGTAAPTPHCIGIPGNRLNPGNMLTNSSFGGSIDYNARGGSGGSLGSGDPGTSGLILLDY